MCIDDSRTVVASGDVRLDVKPSITIPLEPVDSLVVTTLMDNVTDIFMPDQGPA